MPGEPNMMNGQDLWQRAVKDDCRMTVQSVGGLLQLGQGVYHAGQPSA